MTDTPRHPADPIEALVALSRFYGADPAMILAGGGNTSVKVGDHLYVKASGHALATITRDGFVALDRGKLAELAATELTAEVAAREARYKAAIFAARLEPERGQRPSVEALLHHLVPARFVVHTHPTLVNAVACHARGGEIAAELFGEEVLWIPYVDPGYTLGRLLRDVLAKTPTRPRKPHALIMANHGLIVAADDPDDICRTTDGLIARIAQRLGADWSLSFGTAAKHGQLATAINFLGPALRGLLADSADRLPVVTFDDSDPVRSFVNAPAARAATAQGPLTPDQIVYCDSFPLWLDYASGESSDAAIARWRSAISQHKSATGCTPKVVLVPGVGLFAAGGDFSAADTAHRVYVDAIQVMAGAHRLGGMSHLTAAQRRFIEDWEVEAYRRQIARGDGARGRAAGKIAFVTGAAQGFGLEIAQHLAAQGAHVVLADINLDGVQKAAADLCSTHGPGRALGVSVDVTRPDSIAAAIDQAVRQFGGMDIVISNAGVLRAESVKTQSERDFDLVTSVNYKGYFFCVQKAAPILATQHQARPDYLSDIIQINSKSGLAGSNKNGAYAGSKFGGIGLTQSFALELVADGIKVNAVCPGNFFDGPLWSDPDNGLFVQYLRTGKVPGAKTIAEVRRFYEAKVPLGRGCTTADVMAAVYYLIEQRYETGQAVPVTGGQVMLS